MGMEVDWEIVVRMDVVLWVVFFKEVLLKMVDIFRMWMVGW